MTEKLNKTIVKFKYKGKYYEIDWLTDSDPIYKEFDIFNGRGKNAPLVGHISSKSLAKSALIAEAKRELKNRLKDKNYR